MTGCKHSAITFLSDQLCLLGIHDKREYIVEEPGFKNVKNKHLGMSPF